MSEAAGPCLRAGQAWIGTADAVRDRVIRLVAIDGDSVRFEVARKSAAAERAWSRDGCMAERSLRAAYRLATVTEQEEVDAAEVPEPMTLSAVQEAVMAHKRARGLNVTDPGCEIRLLVEGVGGLSRAERMMAPPAEVSAGVADVIILALSIAGVLGFDAGEAVAAKIRASKGRSYRRLPNGTPPKE